MRHDDNDSLFLFLSFCSFLPKIQKKKIIDGNESDSHHYLINERNYREIQRKLWLWVNGNWMKLRIIKQFYDEFGKIWFIWDGECDEH